jgi:hypothetical protein
MQRRGSQQEHRLDERGLLPRQGLQFAVNALGSNRFFSISFLNSLKAVEPMKLTLGF